MEIVFEEGRKSAVYVMDKQAGLVGLRGQMDHPAASSEKLYLEELAVRLQSSFSPSPRHRDRCDLNCSRSDTGSSPPVA